MLSPSSIHKQEYIFSNQKKKKKKRNYPHFPLPLHLSPPLPPSHNT